MSSAQRRAPLLALVLGAYVVWGLFVLALGAVDVGVIDLFKDPTQLDPYLADHPWKSGFSMVGNLAWAATSAMCLLTGAVLRARREGRAGFFLAAGGVFLAIGLDDAFTIHDNFAGAVIGGSSDLVVLSVLALLFLGWAIRYRQEILETSYLVLALGVFALGVPFLLDARETLGIEAGWLGTVEEASELAGIFTLLLYAAVESWRALLLGEPVMRSD